MIVCDGKIILLQGAGKYVDFAVDGDICVLLYKWTQRMDQQHMEHAGPIGRMGQASLASDHAAWSTGLGLPIDGGYLA